MSQERLRTAIGVFATTADLDAVAARLRRQGINQCVACPIAQAAAALWQDRDLPALRDDMLGELRARFPEAIMLRVDLRSASEEALVARTLLESSAQSVQLHDL